MRSARPSRKSESESEYQAFRLFIARVEGPALSASVASWKERVEEADKGELFS